MPGIYVGLAWLVRHFVNHTAYAHLIPIICVYSCIKCIAMGAISFIEICVWENIKSGIFRLIPFSYGVMPMVYMVWLSCWTYVFVCSLCLFMLSEWLMKWIWSIFDGIFERLIMLCDSKYGLLQMNCIS